MNDSLWQKARILNGPDTGEWANKIVWVYGPPEEVSGEAVDVSGKPLGHLKKKLVYLSNVIDPLQGRMHLDADRLELLPVFATSEEVKPVLFEIWFHVDSVAKEPST